MPFAFQYLARNSSSGNTDAGKAWIYNGTNNFGSDETLATIVASGYFNAAQSTLTPFTIAGATGSTGPLAVGDVLSIRGNDENGEYYVTSITTNVTLAVWDQTSGVTYSGSPAVIGNLPAFGDTSGDIVDSGIVAADVVITNPVADQNIAAYNLLVSQGNLQAGSSGYAGTVKSFPATSAKGSLAVVAVANTGDTVTTISNAAMGQASVVSIPDPGASTAKFVLDSGVQQMAVGSELKMDKGTGTESSNAVTISKQAGVITTSSLTTAAGGNYVVTLTNTLVATTSVVLVSKMGGTNTTQNFSIKATAASGSSVITIYNNDPSAALNGTIIIGFLVV